jgi:hypothetical protein
MPRKIKIIDENSEEIESLEKTPPPPEKVKKPRSEKQIQAFKNMIENRKKKPEEVPKEIELPKKKVVKKVEVVEEEEEEEEEYINEKISVEPPKRKRGRPQLTAEKIELKQSMKELELQKQLLKLEKKIQSTAKEEAKKKVLTKIKQKLEEANESGDDSDSDGDDDAINQIVAKHKKPIVIVNKIERDPKKKKPIYEQPQSSVYFI